LSTERSAQLSWRTGVAGGAACTGGALADGARDCVGRGVCGVCVCVCV
jgi:hypothetical protein